MGEERAEVVGVIGEALRVPAAHGLLRVGPRDELLQLTPKSPRAQRVEERALQPLPTNLAEVEASDGGAANC